MSKKNNLNFNNLDYQIFIFQLHFNLDYIIYKLKQTDNSALIEVAFTLVTILRPRLPASEAHMPKLSCNLSLRLRALAHAARGGLRLRGLPHAEL
jgi:hypothetical protein